MSYTQFFVSPGEGLAKKLAEKQVGNAIVFPKTCFLPKGITLYDENQNVNVNFDLR